MPSECFCTLRKLHLHIQEQSSGHSAAHTKILYVRTRGDTWNTYTVGVLYGFLLRRTQPALATQLQLWPDKEAELTRP